MRIKNPFLAIFGHFWPSLV